MSKAYCCRPSELLSVDEEYAAWCLDEACMLVRVHIENGEEPTFHKAYSSFSDMYKNLEKGGVSCR